MNCNEAAPLVAAHADGEIDPLRSQGLRKHLAGCAACTAQYDAVLALRARLGAEVPYFVASPALRARIGAMVSDTARPAAARATHRWHAAAAGALAGCVATILVALLGTAVLQWRDGEDLIHEAGAAHSRATLGQHAIQVASSDLHTVKPWLSARLDYSPPVPDLAAAGFPLLGGRLDYLDGQQVAVLVYGYRQHTIDVFVRPGLFHGATSAAHGERGFNIARATGEGMDWLAVSDASADVLAQFVQRVAAGQPANR